MRIWQSLKSSFSNLSRRRRALVKKLAAGDAYHLPKVSDCRQSTVAGRTSPPGPSPDLEPGVISTAALRWRPSTHRIGWRIVAHNCYSQFQESRLNRANRNLWGRPRPWRGAAIGVASLLASGRRQPSPFRNPSRRHPGNSASLTCWTKVSLTGRKFRCLIVSVRFTCPSPRPATGTPHDRWIRLR